MQNRYEEEYNDNAPGEVAGHLARALEHIQKVHIPQTLSTLQTLQVDPNSPLAQTVKAKLDILQTHAAYVENARDAAASITTDMRIIIGGHRSLTDVFGAEPGYKTAIDEFNAISKDWQGPFELENYANATVHYDVLSILGDALCV